MRGSRPAAWRGPRSRQDPRPRTPAPRANPREPVDARIRPLVGLSTMPGPAFRSPLRDDANAGRVALVTGGGTGIGRATAVLLARSGASVAICGRRPEPLERTRAEIEAAGGACLAMPADVREVATRSMIPGDGGLVVFVGFSPRRGIPGYAHAAAARAASGSLATSLALEWSRHGIRSVSVVPGMIDTEGIERHGA